MKKVFYLHMNKGSEHFYSSFNMTKRIVELGAIENRCCYEIGLVKPALLPSAWPPEGFGGWLARRARRGLHLQNVTAHTKPSTRAHPWPVIQIPPTTAPDARHLSHYKSMYRFPPRPSFWVLLVTPTGAPNYRPAA